MSESTTNDSGSTSGANEPVLWCATVRTKSFEERIRAAQTGGFSTMSMFPIDFHTYTEEGLSAGEMRSMMDEGGVDVTILDPLTKWLPEWNPPEEMSDEDLAFVDFEEDDFFEMAAALDVDSISVIEPFGTEYPIDTAAESFGRVCDRAAEHGWDAHLEFMPMSGIPDLETAWEIVQRADRSNGGLVFDTWHYFRGTPNNELLETVPGERIFRVQMADARTEVQGSLNNDLLHHRLPPGKGDFDLISVTRILNRIGGLSSVGIELFSDEFDDLSAEEAGQRAGTSLRSLLERALESPQ